jgi:Domain of unknown function (DUF222)/HNH endonuclease
MSSTATSLVTELSPKERLEVLFEEVAELTGQRNAIDGRLVEIVAEIDHDDLCGMTGARSVSALVAWKTGLSPANAETIATVAHRLPEFPRCAADMREGRLSLDQVGVIAKRASDGSDEHYAELAASATVTQLRFAIKLEPPLPPPPDADADPDCEPAPLPEPPRSITKTTDEFCTTWKITLPHAEAATVDTALQSRLDGLVADWKREHPTTDAEDTDDGDLEGGWTYYDVHGDRVDDAASGRAPFPSTIDAFLSLIEDGWDTEVARRPHGHRTNVVVHLDVEHRIGALHLGPLLSSGDRRYLTCDASCEVWFERHGKVIGAGRDTRLINRRLRRALEHRDRTCVVPGCGATRGLHAHHLRHWEDGGPTDLDNLVLLCPYHHRLHHRGGITLTGPADRLEVTDNAGRTLTSQSLARPPTTPPPAVPPCPGPTGERADWWWYQPFEPNPPPAAN